MSHANLAIFVPHVGCPNQCSFCNQRSISGQVKAPTPQEVQDICRRGLSQLGQRAPESQIAFFGGSFTAIPRQQMVALLEGAAPFVGKDGFGGIRVSTRPDAVDEEILALLRSYGVCAVELGAQSMVNEVLQRNRRGHTAQQVRQAARLIRAFGMELGLQMMTGLPGDTPQGALYTAKEFVALGPDTVRIYPTVVLEGTDLALWQQEGTYRAPTVQESVPLCATLLDLFEQAGIRVIRVGLHDTETLASGCLGGAYHPAFRELCEGERYWRKIQAQIQALPKIPQRVILLAAPREISKVVGHHRQNLERLAQMGCRAKVVPSPSLTPGMCQVLVEEDVTKVSQTSQ